MDDLKTECDGYGGFLGISSVALTRLGQWKRRLSIEESLLFFRAEI
jgi:hypothetical protein